MDWFHEGMRVLVEKGIGKFGKGFGKMVAEKGWGSGGPPPGAAPPGKGYAGAHSSGKSFDKGNNKGYDKGYDKGHDKGGEKGGSLFMCSLHGKMRSGTAVIDMGDGTFQCKANNECKTAATALGPGDTKKHICKFWEAGTCHKGDSCLFAHGEDEIGLFVPVLEEEPTSMKGGMRSAPY